MIGRCRRHAPTMSGFPVVFDTDWCGDHKLDETRSRESPEGPDPWKHRSAGMRCRTCMFFVEKVPQGEPGRRLLQIQAQGGHASRVHPTRDVKENNAVPLSEPLKEKVVRRVDNSKVANWTEEEKDLIRTAPDKDAAVKVFREKFPETPRSDSAIGQRWTLLKNAAGTSLAPYVDEGPELSEKKKEEEDRIDKPGPDIKKKKAPREDSAQSDEKPLQGTKDAMGSLISVGSKVLLIGNNIGVGEVKAVSQDGIVHAKFPYNTKVLPGERFEVVK